MPDINLVVTSQLWSFTFLSNAHRKVLGGPLGSWFRLHFCCGEVLSRTYDDGQAKWPQVRFGHNAVAVKTSLQCQPINERMLKAIDAKQQGNVLMFHGRLRCN